jgi:hypothetical protein
MRILHAEENLQLAVAISGRLKRQEQQKKGFFKRMFK